MKCYAVINTNVLVSSLITKNNESATVRVVQKIFSGEVIPLFSSDILKSTAKFCVGRNSDLMRAYSKPY